MAQPQANWGAEGVPDAVEVQPCHWGRQEGALWGAVFRPVGGVAFVLRRLARQKESAVSQSGGHRPLRSFRCRSAAASPRPGKRWGAGQPPVSVWGCRLRAFAGDELFPFPPRSPLPWEAFLPVAQVVSLCTPIRPRHLRPKGLHPGVPQGFHSPPPHPTQGAENPGRRPQWRRRDSRWRRGLRRPRRGARSDRLSSRARGCPGRGGPRLAFGQGASAREEPDIVSAELCLPVSAPKRRNGPQVEPRAPGRQSTTQGPPPAVRGGDDLKPRAEPRRLSPALGAELSKTVFLFFG